MIDLAGPNERDWMGIISPEPPTLRGDHHAILDQARQMLATRKRKLPYLVHQRKMKKQDADHQIAIFTFIVEDWEWIVTGKGQRACSTNYQDRKDQLDQSLSTIAEIAKENGFDEKLERQAQLVIAMRWHLEKKHFRKDVYWLAATTHELRNQAKFRIHNGTNALDPITDNNRRGGHHAVQKYAA
ncbi:hypothetical protein AB1K62_00440 [Parasphingorhabdus sp. JC815]|uniref:hypothetical protein n=1 Tax=Parasphingorhabdus sp. JC815 TaxID=3232140 RepID=UPI003458C8BB